MLDATKYPKLQEILDKPEVTPRDEAALEIAFTAGWKEADGMSPVNLEAALYRAQVIRDDEQSNPVQKEQAKGFIARAVEIKVEMEDPSTVEKWNAWLKSAKG